MSWRKNIQYDSDPTKIFHRLCGGKAHTLLLESSEMDHEKQMNSKIVVDSALRITAVNNVMTITAFTNNGVHLLLQIDAIIPDSVSIVRTESQRIIHFKKSHMEMEMEEEERLTQPSLFDFFRWLIQIIKPLESWMSVFFGGLLSYDLINSFEKIPSLHKKNIVCPDICMYLAESMININHTEKKSTIQIYSFSPHPSETQRLHQRLQELYRIAQDCRVSTISTGEKRDLDVTSNVSDLEYAKIIDQMHSLITAGEIFQVVPSRQFYCACFNPFSAYCFLKRNNPSPYMFFMQDEQFTLFGASPESYLKYHSDSRFIELHPIAGTRARGFDSNGMIDRDLDNRIELSLLTDPKELSEHVMLVDLARNDLAKICQTGSRYVSQLMRIEKYSHVMHLVSHVVGRLKKNLDVFHAYQSCMNMGTLTGAPKLRAMQLIAELEPTPRGAYGGSIGYFTGEGSLDTCIIIRSAFVRNNIATVQSGAGVVYDSITEEEVRESKNKAEAVLQSIFHEHHVDTGKFYV